MKNLSKKAVAAVEVSEKYPTTFHIAGADETILYIARDAFEADQLAMAFLAGFEEGSQCNPRRAPADEIKTLREAVARIRAGLANPRNSGMFLKTKREIVAALRQASPGELVAPAIDAVQISHNKPEPKPKGLTQMPVQLPKQHVGKTPVRQTLPTLNAHKKGSKS